MLATLCKSLWYLDIGIFLVNVVSTDHNFSGQFASESSTKSVYISHELQE